MKEEHIQKIIDLIISLAYEIRDLKENECRNSGKVWIDKFIRDELPVPSFFNK